MGLVLVYKEIGVKEKRWNLTGFVCPAISHLFEVLFGAFLVL
jgi:hypothetical protein